MLPSFLPRLCSSWLSHPYWGHSENFQNQSTEKLVRFYTAEKHTKCNQFSSGKSISPHVTEAHKCSNTPREKKPKATETALPTHSFPEQKLPASATQAKCNFCTKTSIAHLKNPPWYSWYAFFQVFVLTAQAKGCYRVNFITNIIFKMDTEVDTGNQLENIIKKLWLPGFI